MSQVRLHVCKPQRSTETLLQLTFVPVHADFQTFSFSGQLMMHENQAKSHVKKPLLLEQGLLCPAARQYI